MLIILVNLHKEVLLFMGSTGFDRLAMTYVSMQAHGMRASKDGPDKYLAKSLLPWLLNLT